MGKQQWERHVIDRRAADRAAFGFAVMRVPMKDGRHLIARQWFLEAAAPKVRVDLARLTLDGVGNGRVV